MEVVKLVCGLCKEEKFACEFYYDRRWPSGFNPNCATCCVKIKRDRKKQPPKVNHQPDFRF